MWRRIEIKNYRSLESAVVELSQFAVVAGPNGSGKSNFVDSLVFARDIAYDAELAMARRGGISSVRRWGKTRPYDVTIDIRAARRRDLLDSDYFRHLFTIHSGQEGSWRFKREVIEVVAHGQVQYSFNRDGSSIVTTGLERAHFPKLSETGSAMLFSRNLAMRHKLIGLLRVRRYRLNPDEMRKPQLATEHWRLEESGSNIASALRHSEDFKNNVVDIMKKIVPGLESITVDQLGRYMWLRFEQNQGNGQVASFTADEMSEGALRSLGIVVAAYQMARDELLIIEEPEVSIHPGAASLLFEVLKEAARKGSVLLTTHSVDLLDAAKDEEILVCNYRNGTTTIGPLASAQRDVVRKGLFSLAELIRSEPLRIEGQEPEVIPPESKQ